jgi:predicted mannosyl-3-phosphoglycerate phosphatase (HAD superfamily)
MAALCGNWGRLMDALINEIVARTGMSREQAALAARIAVDFIRARVSAEARAEIEGVFIGQRVSQVAGEAEEPGW